MADTFFVGQGVRVSLEFRDTANALIDPAVPHVSVLKPNGTHPTYTYPASSEIVKDSTGKYHIDLTVDAGGTWYVRGWATGGITVSSEISFRGVLTNA